MKKVIYRVLISLCIILIVINVFSFLNISFFCFKTYKVATGSMEPYLHVNDIVIIMKSNNYKVNDVITYKKNKEYITHRIVSINDDEIITKGDSNNTLDDPIKISNIVGKVVYRFQFFGFFCYLFSKPKTLIFVFIIGFIVTILIPDKKKRKEYKYEEKEKT